MKVHKEKDFVKGWFIGDFDPSLIKTRDFEASLKTYKKGDYEERHHHKVATEITIITSGSVRMNDVEYTAGDIIEISPGEDTDFLVISESASTVVIKTPSATDDKYLGAMK